jgi:hypothetical protein
MKFYLWRNWSGGQDFDANQLTAPAFMSRSALVSEFCRARPIAWYLHLVSSSKRAAVSRGM